MPLPASLQEPPPAPPGPRATRRAELVELVDGAQLLGMIKPLEDDWLSLTDSSGEAVEIHADDIVAREPSQVSIMPSGLASGLPLTDFAALLAYLESLRE